MLRAAASLMSTAKRLAKNPVRHTVATTPANAA